MSDDYCTVENIIRNCNKVFLPFNDFFFSPGDVIFVAPHYIFYIHLYYGGIHFPDVTFVTVGFDYPMESVITRNSINFILNHPHLKKWIVDNTCIEDHPKLDKITCIYNNCDFLVKNAERLSSVPKIDDVFYRFDEFKNKFERDKLLNTPYIENLTDYYEEMAKYKYVYCPNGIGPKSEKFAEAVALGCIPIIKTPKNSVSKYNGFNFFCIPGLSMHYYNSEYEPVFLESPLCLENDTIQNSIKLLIIPDELKNYNMSIEQAREILNHIRNLTNKIHLTFRVPPWNGEIHYGQHCDLMAMKNKISNTL